jgi:hypothetical protein
VNDDKKSEQKYVERRGMVRMRMEKSSMEMKRVRRNKDGEM